MLQKPVTKVLGNSVEVQRDVCVHMMAVLVASNMTPSIRYSTWTAMDFVGFDEDRTPSMTGSARLIVMQTLPRPPKAPESLEQKPGVRASHIRRFGPSI